MPRTAITLAKTHKGEWQLLDTPDTSMLDQKKNFRAFRQSRAHADFSLVIYQESDGPAEIIRLLTPEENKKREDQHAKDLARFEENTDEKVAAKSEKAAAETRANDETLFAFRTELLNSSQGDLLKLAEDLVKAGRLTTPAKTSKTALVEAILAAKPVPPATP